MKKTTNKVRRKPLRAVMVFICCLLLFIGLLAFFSALWYINTYSMTGFDSILYTLFSDLNGVESDLLIRYVVFSVIPTLVFTALLCLLFFFPWKRKITLKVSSNIQMTLLPMRRGIAILCSIVFSVGLFYWAASITQLKDYLFYISKKTTIFEEQYIDPENTEITFPEKKRNLVYIFMESMENTFFSTEQGGALEKSAIPELYELAENNVNFSCNDGIGGLLTSNGSGWTIGAMVAQTSGVPLKVYPDVDGNDYGKNGKFIPGIETLTDILHKNGYYQTLMVGSDANYGGRKTYFEEHGVDRIYDLYTAREDGIVDPDYNVWWGMEDRHLYRYAKQELAEISAKDKPFSFFMLTVDTHHIGGYVCPNCGDSYEHQYENVLACASKQLAEFVEWMKKQDFYENTSIVVVGDHATMDEEYISLINPQDFSRCIYNCFINSAVKPTKTRERTAFSLDLFPTTLASMGCTIKGERLGLGTNLFSNTPTLSETTSTEYLNGEFMKHSPYYTKEFFLEQ